MLFFTPHIAFYSQEVLERTWLPSLLEIPEHNLTPVAAIYENEKHKSLSNPSQAGFCNFNCLTSWNIYSYFGGERR